MLTAAHSKKPRQFGLYTPLRTSGVRHLNPSTDFLTLVSSEHSQTLRPLLLRAVPLSGVLLSCYFAACNQAWSLHLRWETRIGITTEGIQEYLTADGLGELVHNEQGGEFECIKESHCVWTM